MDAITTDRADVDYSDKSPILIAATSDAAMLRALSTVEASGMRVADNAIVRRNYIHHNGWLGAVCGGSTGNNAVVDSNEVSYNNTRGIDPNWGAGGIKCVLTSNLTFRGNFVHHNVGHGLWCDNCNATTYYLGNRVEDNTFNGTIHFNINSRRDRLPSPFVAGHFLQL